MLLRQKIKGKDFEFEGTPEECLKAAFLLAGGEQEEKEKPIEIAESLTREQKRDIENKMPSTQDVMEYILSKPDFSHSLSEIEKQFFGIAISPYSEERLFHHIYGRTVRARKEIKNKHKGKWKFKLVPEDGRKVRLYIFRKEE